MKPLKSGRYVSHLTKSTMAVVLAGGRGERLGPLTRHRAKPAVTFGSKFRIIDFTLSNCVNSGIRQILVLTQYKAQSLIQHIQRGWSWMRGEFGEFVHLVPAQQQLDSHWYRGTADAVYQNLDLIEAHHPDLVLVLAGDHVYKMDYGPMIAFHVENGADITVGVVKVAIDEARAYGVMTVDEDQRIVRFDEKPADPVPMPGSTDTALASMGIYVFSRTLLADCLGIDAAKETSSHDFGRDILPRCIRRRRVLAYPFEDVATRAQAYWRDVGTVDAFYEANMELVHVTPELNLYDENWPIWTYQEHTPAAKFVLEQPACTGTAINSMVAGGSIVSGATIRESLLSMFTRVGERTTVECSVVQPHVTIGADCRIRRAIIDSDCEIPDGTVIGHDPVHDRDRFHVTENGVVLVTAEMIDQADPASSTGRLCRLI